MSTSTHTCSQNCLLLNTDELASSTSMNELWCNHNENTANYTICMLPGVAGSEPAFAVVQAVADALDGPIVMAKGNADTVACRGQQMRKTQGAGCPRRCGGQGDILSGVTATTMSWAVIHHSKVRC